MAAGVVVTYFLVGYFCDKRAKNSDKFADSLYYMGFLLTLGSLLKFTLGNESEMTTGRLITSMGTGMATTICGLALRVIIIQFRDTISDQEEEARESISNILMLLEKQLRGAQLRSKEAENMIRSSFIGFSEVLTEGKAQLHDSLINITKEISIARERIADNTEATEALLKKCTDPLISTVISMNAELAKHLEGLYKTIAAVTDRVNAVHVPKKMIEERMDRMIEIFQTKASAGLQPLQDAQSKVAQAVTEIGKQIELVNALLEKHQGIANEAVNTAVTVLKTAKEVTIMGNSLEFTDEKINHFNESISSAADTLKGYSNGLVKLGHTQNDIMENLTRLAKKVSELSDSLRCDPVMVNEQKAEHRVDVSKEDTVILSDGKSRSLSQEIDAKIEGDVKGIKSFFSRMHNILKQKYLSRAQN